MSGSPQASKPSVAQLKEMGNRNYMAKNFAEAIIFYTQAIETEETGSDTTKSICFLNRALSKQITMDEESLEEITFDIKESIRLNSKYAKAYLQLCKLHMRQKRFIEAYTEISCAIFVENNLAIKEAELMSQAYDKALAQYKDDWMLKVGNDAFSRVIAIPHITVGEWLYGTENDILSKMILRKKTESNGSPFFEKALKLAHEKKYDDVAKTAEYEDPSAPNFLESCLLAARFYSYHQLHNKAIKVMECFNREINHTVDMESKRRKNILLCKHLVEIQLGVDHNEVLSAFIAATAYEKNNADFYLMTANQLVFVGQKGLALNILANGCKKFPNNFNLCVEYHMSTISDGVDQAKKLKEFLKMHELMVARKAESKLTVNSYAIMSNIFVILKKTKPALKFINLALSKYDDMAHIWYSKGQILKSIDDEKGAALCTKKCLEIEPLSYLCNLEVSLDLLKKTHRYERTEKECQEMFDGLQKCLLSLNEDEVACRQELLPVCLKLHMEIEIRKRFPL